MIFSRTRHWPAPFLSVSTNIVIGLCTGFVNRNIKYDMPLSPETALFYFESQHYRGRVKKRLRIFRFSSAIVGLAVLLPAVCLAQNDLDEYRAFGDEKKASPKPPVAQPAQQTPPKSPPFQPAGASPQPARAEGDVDLHIKDVLERAKRMLGPELNQAPPDASDEAKTVRAEELLKKTAAIHSGETQSAPPRSQLPNESRFRAYENWYKDHAVLNLVVNGDNEKYLIDRLAELKKIRDTLGIPIGFVVVVGSGAHLLDVEIGTEANPIPSGTPPKPTPFAQAKANLSLRNSELHPGADILNRLKISYSPAWIVRYHGDDYVFEGTSAPLNLFPGNGKFLAPTVSHSEKEPRPARLQFALADPDAAVVHRSVRSSGNALPKATPGVVNNDWTKETRIISLLVDDAALPPGAGTYDVLEPCQQSKVVRDRVYHHTMGSNAIDITYYDSEDKIQRERADRWPGVAVPYIPTAFINPFYVYDRIQSFARTLKIRCTPTRFRFVNVGRDRFMETKEGPAAWQEGDGSFRWE